MVGQFIASTCDNPRGEILGEVAPRLTNSSQSAVSVKLVVVKTSLNAAAPLKIPIRFKKHAQQIRHQATNDLISFAPLLVDRAASAVIADDACGAFKRLPHAV